MKSTLVSLFALVLVFCNPHLATAQRVDTYDATDTQTLRVFIFAGQSNMEGGHTRAVDIAKFPPFAGLEQPQPDILYSYNIGREDKATSSGWVPLAPVNQMFGPELSFARRISRETRAPIAIIKCAAGGTHLGGDWNPDNPTGFKLYPLALQWIQTSLAELDQQKVPYRLEGFMWHQGENDMFDEQFKPKYAENLKNFIASWRRDLKAPRLPFYIGELCTKTIWGMDNRQNMFAIRTAQKQVVSEDPLAAYVPTNHDAVEIGGEAGLHYHYGTLGQLEHGENYAEAYLAAIGKTPEKIRKLATWPYAKESPVKLFILAGHRNMEGERGFVQELKASGELSALATDNQQIAFKYNLGGGFRISKDWEPLGPVGLYDTFGPELSFAQMLQQQSLGNIAIAKFTHSGSQINDWTPAGTEATDCNLYDKFIAFVRDAIGALEAKGHAVELAGVFYHVGENDMAFGPYRRDSAKWLQAIVNQSRHDLEQPQLKWFVSQQLPPSDEGLDRIDVTADLAAIASNDANFLHIKVFDLSRQMEKLVMVTQGVVQLGEHLTVAYAKDFEKR